MRNMTVLLHRVTQIIENNASMSDFNITQADLTLLRRFIYTQLSFNSRKRSECEECDWFTTKFALTYSQTFHGYVAIIVCLFGIVTNVLTVAVLTRKDMVCAPINRILASIAAADMVLMIEYTTFAYYYYIVLPGNRNFPYWGAVFVLFHTHFTQVLHTISISLTLALAIWRYIAIGYPEKNRIYCTARRCSLAIMLSYLLPVIVCSPTFFVFQIKATTVVEDKAYVLYHVDLSAMATESETYLVFNFWLYAVVIKILPCCVLTMISVWLVRTLLKVKKRKYALEEFSCPIIFREGSKKKLIKYERNAERTTRMLIAVMVLFLVTEFPQGLFGLLIGMKGKCIFLQCYQKFGEILDILALLNGAINFVLYCSMNKMFRATFRQILGQKILRNFRASSHSDVQTTFV